MERPRYSGRIRLQKTLEIRSTLSPPSDAYIVKDDDDVMVAYIDMSANTSEKGKMYIKGSMEKHTVPSESTSNAWTIRYQNLSDSGVPVMTIDNAGNLKAWNEIEESAILN